MTLGDSDLVLTLTERARIGQLVLGAGYERREEPVVLASGLQTHDLLDASKITSNGVALAELIDATSLLLHRLAVDFDAVGGASAAGNALSVGIAMRLNRTWFAVRPPPRHRRQVTHRYGNASEIVGGDLTGKRILLAEGVVVTGNSLLETAAVLGHLGLDLVGAVALVDRGTIATERFERYGLPFMPLITYEDLGIEPLMAPPNEPLS